MVACLTDHPSAGTGGWSERTAARYGFVVESLNVSVLLNVPVRRALPEPVACRGHRHRIVADRPGPVSKGSGLCTLGDMSPEGKVTSVDFSARAHLTSRTSKMAPAPTGVSGWPAPDIRPRLSQPPPCPIGKG